MEENRKVQIKNFMKKGFDIEIDDKYIEDYDQALTHYNDNSLKGTRKPERLAYLGDAYLEFIVREYLLNHKDNFSLAEIDHLKQQLVENENGWKRIAEEIGQGEQIVTVLPDKRVEDKVKDRKILARSFEALAAVLSYDSSSDDPKEKLIDLFIKLGYLPKK
jgi:dsRNA-specific ribonuclease